MNGKLHTSMRMIAAAAPTVAPAIVPGDASRAMMTWSRAIGDGDMSGKSEYEAENRCRSPEAWVSGEGAKRDVNQCLWQVRLIGRGWRSCEAEGRDG